MHRVDLFLFCFPGTQATLAPFAHTHTHPLTHLHTLHTYTHRSHTFPTSHPTRTHTQVVIAESYGGRDEPVDVLAAQLQDVGAELLAPPLRLKDLPAQATYQLFEEEGEGGPGDGGGGERGTGGGVEVPAQAEVNETASWRSTGGWGRGEGLAAGRG